MTVTSATTRNDYVASSGQTSFTYTFRVLADTDMDVYQNGVLLSSGYTVNNVGTTSGGTVVLDTGVPVGQIVSLVLAMPLDRTTNYQNSGDFLATDVNADFDKIYIGAIQNENEVDRSLRLKDVEPPTAGVDMTIPLKDDRKGKFLGFDSVTGGPIASSFAEKYDSSAYNVYDFTGNGSTTAFTLGSDPVSENNTQVYIDGVYQQKDGYSVSGTVLTFSVAPPNLSNIEVMVMAVFAVGSTSADLVTYTPTIGGETTVQEALVPNQGSLRVDFGENGINTNSTDPVVNVNRNVDDTGYSGNGHCFSDSSNVTRDGGISYNSFDCRIDVSGTENYGHFAPFQNGLVHNTSGTTSILYGYVDVPSVTNGTVGTRYGIKINDVITSGSGAVTNNYAIWIDEQTASSSQKWGIVQKGASKNVFEGQTFFQNLINLHDTVVDDSAVAGTRIGVGTGSAYDLSIMKADYSQYVMSVPTGTNQAKFWGGVTAAGLADGSIYTLTSDQTLYGTGTLGHIAFKNGNGIVGQIQTSGSATSYLTSSDYRLKTDIQPMENAIERLNALEPVNFEWIESGERVDGFIAHDAQLVVPDAVSGEKDAMRTEIVKDEDDVPTGEVLTLPDYQGIDQSKLVPLLTKALQEAISKISSLEARVTALEERI